MTISALSTAGGTLVLAGLQPLLVPSRLTDPEQKIGLVSAARHWKIDRADPR